MLVTNSGKIESVPHTCMMKDGDAWKELLVCKVSLEHTDEELTELFSADTVEDDATGCKWLYTNFVKIAAEESCKYVWLTYAKSVMPQDEYEEALRVLGVETEVADETN